MSTVIALHNSVPAERSVGEGGLSKGRLWEGWVGRVVGIQSWAANVDARLGFEI